MTALRSRLRRLAGLAVPAALLLMAGAAPAGAVGLSFLPTSSTHLVGETLEVDVQVSGLGADGPPSVGEFDIDISFDPSVLSLDGVSFGSFLGTPGVDAVADWNLTAPGRVTFAELSLLGASSLDALQTDAFGLATLSFTAAGTGLSLLEFEEALVGDALGAPLTTAPLASGEVRVVVPEPASCALLALGLGALAVLPRKAPISRRRRHTLFGATPGRGDAGWAGSVRSWRLRSRSWPRSRQPRRCWGWPGAWTTWRPRRQSRGTRGRSWRTSLPRWSGSPTS